jgi:hypothetical protein
MQEAMRVQVLQQDAYRRGGETKLAHVQARRVLRGAELLVLSADYAHQLLFKEQQHSWEMTDLHERAELRMVAFRQGYEGTCAGDALELSSMAVLVLRHRRPKRRAKNRLARFQST